MALISSCAGTGQHTPNVPYDGAMPDSFHILSKNNSLLAEELLKIPDIQDGVSDKDIQTIDRMVASYLSIKTDYDRAFEYIYLIGIPGIRPYNAGVEVLFWIYEDGDRIKRAEKILTNYRKNSEGSLDRMYMNFDLEGLLNIGWDFFEKEKWSDFDIVVNRLTAPETISYYTTKAIGYYPHKLMLSDKRIFELGKTGCDNESKFIANLLKKAGYEADVKIGPGINYKYHVIAVYKYNGKWYIIDNGRPGAKGIIGPFNDYREGPYMIYEGLRLEDRRY